MAYLQSKKKSWKGISDNDLRVNREELRTTVYQSNLDITLQMTYNTYRQHWLLEMMFDLYKNTERFDDTHIQSNSSVNGKHPVNFVSTITATRLMNLFLENGLLEKMILGKIMDALKRSLQFVDEKDDCVFCTQRNKEKEILRTLDFVQKRPQRDIREAPQVSLLTFNSPHHWKTIESVTIIKPDNIICTPMSQ